MLYRDREFGLTYCCDYPEKTIQTLGSIWILVPSLT